MSTRESPHATRRTHHSQQINQKGGMGNSWTQDPEHLWHASSLPPLTDLRIFFLGGNSTQRGCRLRTCGTREEWDLQRTEHRRSLPVNTGLKGPPPPLICTTPRTQVLASPSYSSPQQGGWEHLLRRNWLSPERICWYWHLETSQQKGCLITNWWGPFIPIAFWSALYIFAQKKLKEI